MIFYGVSLQRESKKQMNLEKDPLLEAAFCSICSKYGHFTDECTDSTAVYFRKAQFLEQLIPFEVRRYYGIETSTPIGAGAPLKETEIVYISDIKKELELRSIPISTKQEENKRKIERWAIENGKKICYKKNEKKKGRC